MKNKKTRFWRADFARGFSVNIATIVRDHANNDLVLADLTGSKQAVRSNVMQLKTRKTQHWILGGPTKMDKVNGHITQRADLPNGHVNWVIVSRQAIPNLLNPTRATFFWHENKSSAQRYDFSLGKMPPSFYPIFAATVSFPTLPQWAEHIWKSQIERSHLIQNLSDTKGVRAYKLIPNNDDWQLVIEKLFSEDKINIYQNQPTQPEPEPEQEPRQAEQPVEEAIPEPEPASPNPFA